MQRLGDSLWTETPKIHAELFTLTYGALVNQLLSDGDNIFEVNDALDKMGYNIGVRIIDEFLAKSGIRDCSNLKETAEAIAKVGFKMFLGVSANVMGWNDDESAFSLQIGENPITNFVELPIKYKYLKYSNILCGVIRGALEMVQVNVTCTCTRDMILGDTINEFRVEFKGVIENVVAEDYHD